MDKEDLQKQKKYLQCQCRKAGLTIKTLRKEIETLKGVNEEHRKLNGKLREEINELEKINNMSHEYIK